LKKHPPFADGQANFDLKKSWLVAYSSIHRGVIHGLQSTNNFSESSVRNSVPVVGGKKIRVSQLFLRLISTMRLTEANIKTLQAGDFPVRTTERSKSEANRFAKARALVSAGHFSLQDRATKIFSCKSGDPDKPNVSYTISLKSKVCDCADHLISGKLCKHIYGAFLCEWEGLFENLGKFSLSKFLF
jgi:hypothetical protein